MAVIEAYIRLVQPVLPVDGLSPSTVSGWPTNLQRYLGHSRVGLPCDDEESSVI